MLNQLKEKDIKNIEKIKGKLFMVTVRTISISHLILN